MPSEPSTKGTRRSLRIGPYAVESPLTLGSLGAAYRATDTSSGRTVALKVLPPELVGNAAARERIQREARRAARVHSPHLANVLDFGDASGTWYLAMELVEGTNLAEFVQKRGALDGEAARDVLVQVAGALALLHREGLVPRDLSASNFRVVTGPDARGRITVKLLDLGLLRPAGDAGTGDLRAALGALGATAAYLLSGRSGKAELSSLGGDVSDDFRAVLRRLLARRPEERYPTPAALLEALGAEEPLGKPEVQDTDDSEDRQGELLADPLAALAAGEEDAPAAPPKAPAARKPPRRRGESEPDDEPAPAPDADDAEAEDGAEAPTGRPRAPGSRKGLVIGAAVFGGVLVLGAVGLGVVNMLNPADPNSKRRDPAVANLKGGISIDGATPASTGVDTALGPKKSTEPEKGPEKPATKPPEQEQPPGQPQPEAPPPPPPLYTPKERIVEKKLINEFVGPFVTGVPVPNDAPIFLVTRVALPGGKPGTTFDSIAAACAAIPEGSWGRIELRDNGPFFEGPIDLRGKSANIYSAQGYSPLIVWDTAQVRAELKPAKPGVAAIKDDSVTFLSVEKGSLILDNVHLAVDWPEKALGSPCLVRVAGGQFYAKETTFSVAGKPKAAVTAVRFDGGTGLTCRLKQCYARGARLTVLDLPQAGAEVLIDNSLFVTTEAPVLAATGGRPSGPTTTVRVIRSTLMGHDAMLKLRPGPEAPGEPTLNWMGWDLLAWRAAETSGGTMVELPREAGSKALTWRAVNSLYAGWETLISGHEPIPGTDTDAWHARWKIAEGDVSVPQAWVVSLPADPAETLPAAYHSYPGPVGFAATYGRGVLGCDLWQLPWVRFRWIDLANQLTRPSDIDTLHPSVVQAIPEANDQLYHGESLDLNTVDLGKRLAEVQKTQKLAPMVVMHVHGTGRRRMTPVRWEKANLWLHFEPTAEGAEPLVLEPEAGVAPEANALIEVLGANLWILGADVRCPDFKTALLPHYVVRVNAGNLFMSACRLQGPMLHPPKDYWGLVNVEGTGWDQRQFMCQVSANWCVLLSGQRVLHLAGPGIRMDLRDSLIVATDWAVDVQPAVLPTKPVPTVPTPRDSPSEKHFLFGESRLNLQLTADHCTFAAREAVFYMQDLPSQTNKAPYVWPVVADPTLLEVKDCAFLNPFVDKEGKSASALMASCLAALERGSIRWQGQGNVYDKRLHAYLTRILEPGSDRPPRTEKAQSYTTWERLWGPAETKPILDVALKNVLELDREKLALDQLALPAQAGMKEKPGADLPRLLAPRKK
jgi:hypothetical protein